MERQGFYAMLGLCVAIIVGTAIWTRAGSPPVTPPANAADEAGEAGEDAGTAVGGDPDFVQRLSDVTWTYSDPDAPEVSPWPDVSAGSAAVQGAPDRPSLAWPVRGEVLRAHSQTEPVYLPTLGAWAVHDGLDIAAKAGDPVNAALSGTVGAAYADPMLGNVLEVQHPGGLTSRFAGLATLNLLRVGDPVKTGQLLSPLGSPMPLESEDPPHLHFELLKDGEWVDPREYLAD
jgi:murein DD-endopeptidase MepM/ murein hydrolase activator NlpD